MRILNLLSYGVLSLLVANDNLDFGACELAPINQRNELLGKPSPVGSIWPRPYHLHSNESNYFAIDTFNFEIVLLNAKTKHEIVCPSLTWAISHYRQLVLKLHPKKKHKGKESAHYSYDSENRTNETEEQIKPWRLVIEIYDCEEYPQDFPLNYELYSIDSKEPKREDVIAFIYANSALAAIRGLESFYQMLWIWEDEREGGNFEPDFCININSTYILDKPRFSHRGLMLDTARHFLPERTLIKILTGMMYNKLSVFHWHIIDDQSFPFESKTFPELSQKGAYHANAVYSPEAVQRIIEAARVRGIRTILEFDTPGHAGGIGKSHQELLTPCYGDGKTPGTRDPARFAAYENLDPTNEKVYDFMLALFTEIVRNVTRDKYVHLGMDEVYPPCWESSPEIKKFMDSKNYTKVSQVQEFYTTRHVAMVKSLGAKMIAWQDPIDEGVKLDKDVVIHFWKDYEPVPWEENYLSILKKGYRILFSSCWYINYINYGQSWRRYFECDPYLNGQVPYKHRSQVLGGEAAIWAEFVDATNIIPRIFPFVGAIGSVLWDSNIDGFIGRENTENAMFRLDRFRCSLLKRGIAAQPIYNGNCGPDEFDSLVEDVHNEKVKDSQSQKYKDLT